MPAERVALLGTGNMGSAIARRLAENGFALVLYNRSVESARVLAQELAATTADTPAAAAAQADVIITMVSDDSALRDVCVGTHGVVLGAPPHSVTIQTSTVLPDTVREISGSFAARGLGFLDSPVSGSVTSARSGELALMIGGESDAIQRARPVLEVMARRIFEVGAVGNGAAVKLAVNHIIFSINVALSEALVLAEAGGVERGAAYDVFAGGAADAPFVQYKRPAFVDPGSLPPAFSMTLAEKDMVLIGELARSLDVQMPQAEVNLSSLRRAAATLGADRDFSELAVYLRSRQHSSTGRQ